jgi:hypothetical protein
MFTSKGWFRFCFGGVHTVMGFCGKIRVRVFYISIYLKKGKN